MQLKEAIIDYLLEDEPDYDQGLALLGVAGTHPHLLHLSSVSRSPDKQVHILAHHCDRCSPCSSGTSA
jgi:hypothetical protein